MKKFLLLLSLTCLPLSADIFEDICLREGINEQFLSNLKPIPQGIQLYHLVAGIVMDYYNSQLAWLIAAADEKNPAHESIIRKIVAYCCNHVRSTSGTKFMHEELDRFDSGQCSYTDFLRYAKGHLSEVLPEKTD